MMATNYLPFKIALTDGQKKKLQRACSAKSAVTLRVKSEQIGRGDELLLTGTQINKLNEKSGQRAKGCRPQNEQDAD